MLDDDDKFVVLDRDGVINRDSDHYIRSAEEWQPQPGSIEAIQRLCSNGYRVAIATNQSGLARGYFSSAELDAMHQKLDCLLGDNASISYIAVCPHHPNDECECRKPKTGLLQQIESELGCSLKGRWFVGDSLKDLQAAERFNMQPVLVETGKGGRTLSGQGLPEQTLVFSDLAAVVDNLLAQA